MGVIGWMLLFAGVWGIAEATFFFIIPDVILTLIAMHGFKRGAAACMSALLGALLGGMAVYLISTHHFDMTYAFVSSVPGISSEMLAGVEAGLKQQGVIAMIIGPIKGIPYKTFAMMAPVTGVSLLSFLLASIPARFIRFIATSTLAWWLARIVFKRVPMWVKYTIWLVIWIFVYIIYFSIHQW